jgi:hypothetical protein
MTLNCSSWSLSGLMYGGREAEETRCSCNVSFSEYWWRCVCCCCFTCSVTKRIITLRNAVFQKHSEQVSAPIHVISVSICGNFRSHNRDVLKSAMYVAFQVLTATSMKATAFWNTKPRSLVEVDRRFRSAYLPDGGGSTHLSNVGLLQRDCTEIYLVMLLS